MDKKLAEQVHTPYCKQAPMCKTPCGNPDCVEQTEQEPVAWLSEGGDVSRSKKFFDGMGFKSSPLYAAPQPVQQEPVAIIEKEAGFETEVYATGHADSLPDGVFKLYAAPVQQAEQEPVADVVVRPLRGDQSLPTTDIKWLQKPTTGKLYAAPVRTKDLTDGEVWCVYQGIWPFHPAEELKLADDIARFARAVIAADREKNK